MKRVLILATFLASAAPATAADMPQPQQYPPRAAIPMAPAYNWSGFYAGAMGGYGQSSSASASLNGVTVSTSTTSLKGGFAGGTLGYNFVTGPVLFGVEADGAWSGIGYSASVGSLIASDKIKAFGSVTGRVGVPLDAFLFYGKGGYAIADNEISASQNGLTASISRVHSGWTIGGGFEYLFLPNWSAKVEYMYVDYLNTTYNNGIGLGVTVNTIKGGINYHFGGPIVARY